VASAALLVNCSLLSLDGLSGDETNAGPTTGSSEGGRDASDGGDANGGDARPSSQDATPSDGELDGPTTCGVDGGIACNGVCVDPTSDPHNCNGCGNVCSNRCGTSIVESMASAPASWKLNGSAKYDSSTPSTVLTPIGNSLAGSLVYAHPVVVDAFDLQFAFRMGYGGGARSDGMGFVLEQNGPTAVGATGGGLGMTGLAGYGIELDTFDNRTCGDVSADHVGVDSLSVCSPDAGFPTSLVSKDVTAIVDVGDARFHEARVVLANGAVSVSIDGHAIVTGQSLPSLHSGAAYYFGFTAATGGLHTPDGGPGGFRQEVNAVTITFPTPRCL
jgi:hypothetical protein